MLLNVLELKDYENSRLVKNAKKKKKKMTDCTCPFFYSKNIINQETDSGKIQKLVRAKWAKSNTME